MGIEAFFARRTSTIGRAAIEVCSTCPVRSECLDYALKSERTDGLRIGIWGGLGPYERTALAREARDE